MPGLASLYHPDLYHGHGKTRGFFEGWYFKLVDASEQHRYAIIPGVFMGDAPGDAHAFVQTLDGVTGETRYYRYPFSALRAARDEFDLHIGPNHFHRDGLTLDLDSPAGQFAGELSFAELTPWPVTWHAPGIMGPFAFAPFMECYHGIVSLDHRIAGVLRVDGVALDFTAGRGYIEKDWGQAFPRAWVWMQSNHFAQPATCFTASVAIIPWLGRSFRGLIVALWHEGQLHRLATYTGAHTASLRITGDEVAWHVVGRGWDGRRSASYDLQVRAIRAAAGMLHGPTRVAMLQRVPETLTARIAVTLTRLERGGARVLFEEEGRHAGLEVAGALGELSAHPNLPVM